MSKSTILALILSVFLASGMVIGATTTDQQMNSSKTTQQYVSDSSVTSKVKSKLFHDKKIKRLAIAVRTNNGIVTVTGIVDTAIQKEKILYIAHKTSGVKGVRDELIVNATPTRTRYR